MGRLQGKRNPRRCSDLANSALQLWYCVSRGFVESGVCSDIAVTVSSLQSLSHHDGEGFLAAGATVAALAGAGAVGIQTVPAPRGLAGFQMSRGELWRVLVGSTWWDLPWDFQGNGYVLLIYLGGRSQDKSLPSTRVISYPAPQCLTQRRGKCLQCLKESYCSVQFFEEAVVSHWWEGDQRARGFLFLLDCQSLSQVSVGWQGNDIYSDHPLHGSSCMTRYSSNVSAEHLVSHPAQGDFHLC